MKKLICVCGAPRSRTTFIFSGLLAHPFIQGSCSGNFSTNESERVMHEAIIGGDYSGLASLYAYWGTKAGTALALKAPGYLFAEQYFVNNPFGLEVLFVITERDPVETIISNMHYPDAVRHVCRPVEQTDCPRDKINKYVPHWTQAGILERVAMRHVWHIEAVRPAGAFLVTPGDYVSPTRLARRICSFCGVPNHNAVASHFKTFADESYSEVEYNEVAAVFSAITSKLSE